LSKLITSTEATVPTPDATNSLVIPEIKIAKIIQLRTRQIFTNFWTFTCWAIMFFLDFQELKILLGRSPKLIFLINWIPIFCFRLTKSLSTDAVVTRRIQSRATLKENTLRCWFPEGEPLTTFHGLTQLQAILFWCSFQSLIYVTLAFTLNPALRIPWYAVHETSQAP
jgi:hypothetical protein